MAKNPLKTVKNTGDYGPAFVTFDLKTQAGRDLANKTAAGLTDSYQAVARNLYQNFEPNISVRDSFSRGDYEYFRPNEAVPKKQKEIISFCMEAYRRVGIVRNVIDLMADFAVQGIKIVHPNKKKQRLLRAWAERVQLKEKSERFVNILLRAGNVVVRRGTARLTSSEEEKMAAQATKLEADTPSEESLSIHRRVIPMKYTFLNPASLEIIGGDLAQFTGKQIIGLKITSKLKRQITQPTDSEKQLLPLIPQFIINAVKQGKTVIPLEQEKLIVASYKKDDWQEWADPMTYAILDDLIILEKMKLADLAALDGAISQIRVWKLGNLDKGMMPTAAAIDKLTDILMANPGGGAFDLIWGPDLEFQEFKTDVHHFLGGDKYEPVLKSIYQGLGIPPTLTGSEGASGTTNNFISLQTMIQRLSYVRDKLAHFWKQELELVRQGLNFQDAGQIHFDRMTLSDESAEKALLIQLWDRNLISDEAILERFKEFPDLENLRLRREQRERERKLRQEKTGPYFPGDKIHEYIKIALQRGYVSPEDLDIDITTKPTPFDKQLKAAEKAKAAAGGGTAKKKGKAGSGRPKTSKDSGSRKARSFKVRTSAEQADTFADFMTKNIWAKETQRTISEHLNPVLLKYFNKNNLRELSDTEAIEAEKVKFTILAHLEPYSEVSKERILNMVQDKPALPSAFSALHEKFVAKAYEKKNAELTIEDRRNIQCSVYSLLK